MACKLKEGYDKFPRASRRLAQTIFQTNGSAGLLEGLRPARRRQAVAMILSCCSRQLSDPEDSEEPAGAEGEGQGYERRLFSRVHVDHPGDAMHLSGDE